MSKEKSLVLSAMSRAILRLSRMEKSSMNPYSKKDIQNEITDMVSVMTGHDDFVDFLLEKLNEEDHIRADERLKISLESKSKQKTGPLGNPIQEKLEKVGETILGKDDSA